MHLVTNEYYLNMSGKPGEQPPDIIVQGEQIIRDDHNFSAWTIYAQGGLDFLELASPSAAGAQHPVAVARCRSDERRLPIAA